MDTRIRLRLHAVGRRIRSRRMGWSLACVWLASAFLAWWLASTNAGGGNALAFWAIATGIGFVAAVIWGLKGQGDLSGIAQRIEDSFPGLNQTLLTAVDMRPVSGSSFGYLQRSVITQAIRHDVIHQWRRVVPQVQVILGWLCCLASFGCMLFAGFTLWKLPPASASVASSADPSRSSDMLDPVIVPGDTEIERGSSLIVTAQFDGVVPDEVWLEHSSVLDGDTPSKAERIKMRPSLKDPLFAAYLYNVSETLLYRVDYGSSASREYRVEVFEYPALVRADAVLEFPDYTELETKTVVDTRRVTAAVGTELTWQLHLNKPIASGLLRSESGDVLELEPSEEEPRLLSATHEVEESVTWKLELLDHDGRKNEVDYSLRVKAIKNATAEIKLTQGGDRLVSAIEEFNVKAEIKDDFAVVAAGVGYQLGGGELVEKPVAVEDRGKKLAIGEMIDFEALNAEPYQLLSYYVWAEDRDEFGEPRRSMSDMFFAEVRPFDEIYRRGQQPSADQQQQQSGQQQQGNQQTQELLELQRQIVVGTWNVLRKAKREKLPDSTGPDITLLGESQEEAVTLLEEKAAEVEVPGAEEIINSAKNNMLDASEALYRSAKTFEKSDLTLSLGLAQAALQDLLRLQSREHEVVRSQRSQSQSSSQSSRSRQQQIDQLELDDQENRYENERLAEEQQSEEQSELRQIMSRLRELAARQEDLNEQLREIEAALQEAETEQEREELQRQLERLREEQQEMLQDSDELQERMQDQESDSMQDVQEQMEQVRENLQQSSEALRNGNTNQALTAGTRAEEELKQLQDEVRQQAANQFAETMQDMRQKAAELEQKQDEIIEELSQAPQDESGAGLRASETELDAGEKLAEQQKRLDDLLEQMQRTVEESEEAEPLLAQKLYDSFRRTKQSNVDDRLEQAEMLLRRNLDGPARREATEAVEDIAMLREDIDEAAEAVLGNEVDSLRLALNQLEQLSGEVDSEIAEATGRDPASPQSRDPSEASDESQQAAQSGRSDEQRDAPERSTGDADAERTSSAEQRQEANTQNRNAQNPDSQGESQQPSERAEQQQSQSPSTPASESASQQAGEGQQQQDNQQQSSQQQDNQQQDSQQQDSQQQGNGRGQPSDSQQRQNPQSPGLRQNQQPQSPRIGNPNNADDRGGRDWAQPGADSGRRANPISGDDFRDWSDRLRDVEELVLDPELRWEATQIRQSAREIRRDLKKHAADPKWSEVEDLVAAPLRELQRKVSDELIRRAAERTEIVPIDRDPVPSEFSRSVQEYYENLGVGL